MPIKPPSKPIEIPPRFISTARDGTDCVKLSEFLELFTLVHEIAIKLDKIEEVIMDTIPSTSTVLGESCSDEEEDSGHQQQPQYEEMNYDEYIPLPSTSSSEEENFPTANTEYEEDTDDSEYENSIFICDDGIVDLTTEDYDPSKYYV